jgi:hypothetical protein
MKDNHFLKIHLKFKFVWVSTKIHDTLDFSEIWNPENDYKLGVMAHTSDPSFSGFQAK